MPEKMKQAFLKKLDKAAAKVTKNAKNLKPSLKVKALYSMFRRLHLSGKMWEIDNEYWKKETQKMMR